MMHMHIPNKNALMIPPNSWPRANMVEEISMAATMPVLIFNLLNKTPLNISSSRIGANTIEDIASKRNVKGSTDTGVKSSIGILSGYKKL